MRKIGELPDEQQARIFSAALYARGMENDVESEEAGGYSVWVHDDDQLTKAREFLEEFRKAPTNPEWESVAAAAARKRKEEERAEAKRGSHVVTRERMEYERTQKSGFAGLPMVLAVLAIAGTILAGDLSIMPGGGNRTRGWDAEEAEATRIKNFEMVSITKLRNPTTPEAQAGYYRTLEESGGRSTRDLRRYLYDPSLPEIRSGQVWRFFTPIFVHFGLIHLLFNLMWIRDLGSLVQNRLGMGYLAVLVLTTAAISNLVQLAWSHWPYFGGLSGVNYGLLGFLWMRGKFERGGFELHPQIVQWMMIWFVLCFTPLIPNVANGAHAGGLAFGMLVGYATAQIANARRTRL